MDIRCGSCSKLFRVADEKIAGKGIRFKCSKCGEVITVTKQDFEMDVLAREGDAAPAAAQPPKPRPSAPTPSPPAAPPAEPVAREYKPPPPSFEDQEEPAAQEYKAPEAPTAGLDDFDFSPPDIAAQHAQQRNAGLGDFSLGEQPEAGQEAAGELNLSEDDANAAEDAFAFPVDLISEPKRKAPFGAASGPDAAPSLQPEQETEETQPGDQVLDEPSAAQAPGLDAVPDLGDLGAPASETAPEPAAPRPPAAAALSPSQEAAVPPKGPVISPELLAQMKRASASRTVKQAPAPQPAEDAFDLGAALAIPKGAGTTAAAGAASSPAAVSTAARASGGPSGKRVIILGVVALVLVAALAALYFLGVLWGKREQIAQQAVQRVKQEFTPEGLAIVDPVAYVDPEKGDLVITGTVRNSLDRTKPGWYLVIDVTDGSQKVVATVRMVNGVQLYTKRDYGILAKRGVNADEILASGAKAVRSAVVPAKGNVVFEARLYEPPAGIAGFLPVLKTFDPEAVHEAVAKEAVP